MLGAVLALANKLGCSTGEARRRLPEFNGWTGPPRLQHWSPPKYAGQRTAYMVGAHRPLTFTEINDHNAEVSRRRDAARLAARQAVHP